MMAENYLLRMKRLLGEDGKRQADAARRERNADTVSRAKRLEWGSDIEERHREKTARAAQTTREKAAARRAEKAKRTGGG